MSKQFVVALAVVSLISFPAGLKGDGLPKWTGCHEEVQITQVGPNKITCIYDPAKVYQAYTYYTRSQSQKFVCRMQVVEVWHKLPASEVAPNPGMRDPGSVHNYYRVEYSNKTVEGDKKSYIDVLSGPNGFLIEILTLIPIEAAPAGLGEAKEKTAAQEF